MAAKATVTATQQHTGNESRRHHPFSRHPKHATRLFIREAR